MPGVATVCGEGIPGLESEWGKQTSKPRFQPEWEKVNSQTTSSKLQNVFHVFAQGHNAAAQETLHSP